jgi:3-dehydroquinate synthase
VGGKTGINHAAGKNLIGAIHQPALVICDTDFLETLSQREMVSGLGEVAKYGLIYDPAFLRYLERNAARFLAQDRAVLERAVRVSLAWKCRVVARDELDRKGIREALNFGHTFGHALESATAYRRYQHGEAVIWGMRFALALSEVRGHLTAAGREPLERFLASLPVPPIPARLRPADFFARMKRDKKVRGGRIHFVLLKRPGRTVSDARVSEKDLHRAAALIGLRGAR